MKQILSRIVRRGSMLRKKLIIVTDFVIVKKTWSQLIDLKNR